MRNTDHTSSAAFGTLTKVPQCLATHALYGTNRMRTYTHTRRSCSRLYDRIDYLFRCMHDALLAARVNQTGADPQSRARCQSHQQSAYAYATRLRKAYAEKGSATHARDGTTRVCHACTHTTSVQRDCSAIAIDVWRSHPLVAPLRTARHPVSDPHSVPAVRVMRAVTHRQSRVHCRSCLRSAYVLPEC